MTDYGPARYQGTRRQPMDPTTSGPKKLASEVNGYQSGIGQGHGSSYVSNSGQSAPPIRSTQGIAGFQRPLAPATTIVGQYMPYTDAQDPNLPENVKKLPDLKKRQWVAVWNSTYKRCRDAGGSDECESKAFQYANGVVKNKSLESVDALRSMQTDAAAELEAIKLYGKHLRELDDPEIAQVLQHVITEEHEHYELFSNLIKRLTATGEGARSKPSEVLVKALGEASTTVSNTTRSTAKKMTQEAAEYSPTGGNEARSCSNCFWYRGGSSCHVVSGTIAPNGLSSLWTAPGVNDESEADDMASGNNKELDESTLGLLLDWAQENPDQVEFMLDNIGKEKALDPTHMGQPRDDRAMRGSSLGIMQGIDVKTIGSGDFLEADGMCHCAACDAVDDSEVAEAQGKALLNEGWLGYLGLKAKLTTSQRDSMSNDQFAYVDPSGGKHFPIHDASHVRNALARLNQSPFGPKARAKVMAAAKKFGIKVSGDGNKSFKSFLSELLLGRAAAPTGSPWSTAAVQATNLSYGGESALFKGKDGELRVYLRASNNFKDHHGEILSEAAHKDYEQFVDKYEQHPLLLLWHMKGTRWGQADLVTYSDGFVHVIGTVDKGCEEIARNIVKSGAAVSHGFLTFNQRNNVIDMYRSWEFSALPRGTEANPWFTKVGEVGGKDMAFAPAKRAWMEELGVPSEMIKALELESENAQGLLQGLGVASKAVDKPKPEAGVAGQAKRKRPDQLHTAVGQDDDDNDTEPDDDEDDKAQRTNNKELAIVLKSFSDRLAAIEQRLEVHTKSADDIIAERYAQAVGAKGVSPTAEGSSNSLTPEVGSELEKILGRSPVTGQTESPNSWFGEIVKAVEGSRA